MPDVTHDGNDPMGAPTSHRGPLDTCPAPDCQDRTIEQQATWVDGDPLLEAVASAVHEQCETGDGGIVHDDPRNIAVAVKAALRRLATEGFEPTRDREAPEPAALPAAVPVAVPPTGQTALRDLIAEALHAHLARTADIHLTKGAEYAFVPEVTDEERLRITDAVLAVLPPPADRAGVLRELHDRIRRGEVPYQITPAADAHNHNGIPGVLAYAQTALMQWLRDLADQPAEHRQPHPTHGDLLTALTLLPADRDAVHPANNTAAEPTPAPLTPCTCQQAIHKTEHTDRTVPGCPWCMPTPNIRPNRKPPRTTGDVQLPDHTIDEEA